MHLQALENAGIAVRILYLYPKLDYERKMSLCRVFYAEALARQPGVELRFWGPGWPGYHPGSTLSDNLRRIEWKPDVVLVYRVAEARDVPLVDAIRVISFNEAYAPETLDEIRRVRPHLIVFHHENDLPRWRHLEQEGIRLVHIPHCVAPEFFAGESTERPIDCIVTGRLDPDLYPLRCRFARLIREGRIPGVVREHPGYRLNSHQQCRRQYADYVAQLKQAKVSLCCTSRYRYALAKLAESMAAGCLVVSDLPDDSVFCGSLGRYITTISASAPDTVLIRAAMSCLASAASRGVPNAAGFSTAHATHHVERYGEQLLSALVQIRRAR